MAEEHDYRVGNILLNWTKVRKIRELYAAGYTQRELGELFGVKRRTIGDVVKGVTWKEQTQEEN